MSAAGWAGVAATLAAGVLGGTPAMAEVIDSQTNGFQIEIKTEIAAPAAKVWAALVDPARWWDPAHTLSHDPRRLSLDLKPGGCFCEALPDGGFSRRLAVEMVAPGQQLVLGGAMGPMLDSGTQSHLRWSLTESGGTTKLDLTFYAGGYWRGGYQSLAPVVDRVMTGLTGRLKRYVETGTPAP